MRFLGLLALSTAVLPPCALAQARTDPPSLSSARVTAQVLAGTVAGPVAFFGAGIATKRVARALGANDDEAGRAAYVGAYASTWLATATVPALIGRDGKFPAALGGSALGALAAAGLVRVGNWRYDGDRRECGPLCWTMGALVFALPSIGATIAYDQSRR
ncbi:MAG: hypothetical protein IT359_13855 [Gemmatimonadaceae bacterium]|nr:hypothetical protein [Gemmatimonadaceae bacterium]